jgi:hypothetical protein
MNSRFLAALLALAAFAGCTSVKVDRRTTAKYSKVPPHKVDQTSQDGVAGKPHEVLATVQMSTKGRFASRLSERAKKVTGKLGGNAYLVTAGDTSTRITGGLMGTFADETVANMTFDVIKWTTPPVAPTPTPKPGANATTPATTAAPAPAPTPAKKKPWYWPF